jgi:hypothetical protein
MKVEILTSHLYIIIIRTSKEISLVNTSGQSRFKLLSFTADRFTPYVNERTTCICICYEAKYTLVLNTLKNWDNISEFSKIMFNNIVTFLFENISFKRFT